VENDLIRREQRNNGSAWSAQEKVNKKAKGVLEEHKIKGNRARKRAQVTGTPVATRE
jgi:hypothetical protein